MKTKKLVRGTILTVFCMAAMLYWNSSVSRAFWVEAVSDGTRIRNSASTESEVMTSVNGGDKLSVVSEEQDGAGNKWYKVSINNVSGYVRADVVRETSEPGAEATIAAAEQPVQASATSAVESMASQAATVKTDNVNVRSEASTGGSVVATLQNGAAVTLTGTASDGSGKTWYQVNFINNGSNVTGYIREDFVEPGEVMDPQTPMAEAPEEGDSELNEMYGDMPAEEQTANNDYELFYEPDQDGVDCWYIHDNIIQKRYKLEQLMQADEMNTHNLEIKDQEIGRLKIVLIVLAVLLVLSLAAAGFFGFKYHDLKDEDEEEDDDDDDDFRAAPVRRRERPEAEYRRREPSRSEERKPVRRPEAGEQRRTAGGQRRPEREEVRTRSPQGGRTRPEAEAVRRQSAGAQRTRSAQPGTAVRRAQPSAERETVRRSGRSDVEWKSKNFLSGDEDGLDFSFINGDDEE